MQNVRQGNWHAGRLIWFGLRRRASNKRRKARREKKRRKEEGKAGRNSPIGPWPMEISSSRRTVNFSFSYRRSTREHLPAPFSQSDRFQFRLFFKHKTSCFHLTSRSPLQQVGEIPFDITVRWEFGSLEQGWIYGCRKFVGKSSDYEVISQWRKSNR